MIPEIKPPRNCVGLIAYFNELRSFCGSIDNVMDMGIIEKWQRHSGIVLSHWEREAMFSMDRALRRSYSDVIKFHAKRTKINLDKKK